MRKVFFGTVLLLLTTVVAHAQTVFSGKLVSEGKPVDAATVSLSGTTFKTISLQSNDSGYFSTDKVPLHAEVHIAVQAVGKVPYRQVWTFEGTPILIEIRNANTTLEPLEIRAVRASEKAPFAKSVMTQEQIAQVNTGKDLPYILNQTPSVIVNSDAGNGIGYTGIRIRGTDASRTNVTINGIPYNDAESQGAYFVDIPDVVSSANSIQVQRGVGTSTNGAGAFGASININTNQVHELPYTHISNTYGSFNSWKNTVAAGTGLINNHFYADVRLSNISSDGYIQRAATNLQSMLFSTGYTSDKTSLKFNFITGKEKTYQAWNGVYEGNLNDPAYGRTYNELGIILPDSTYYKDQTDNYVQTHYQLFWDQQLAANWRLSVTGFLSRGYGYYQEYKNDAAYTSYGLAPYVPSIGDTIRTTNLIRQKWLDNYFYGQTFALQYKNQRDEVILGGAWTQYDGKHYGKMLWTANGGIPNDYQYYGDFPAHKNDQNVYLKWQHELYAHWNIYADAQYRHVQHRLNGDDDDATFQTDRNFNFFNPKAGISYLNNGYTVFASYAIANKEPGRSDMVAAAIPPASERLNDLELGISKSARQYNWGVNLYYMDYKNQLVLTGQLNNVGSPIRVNVPNSYRLGIELQGGYTFTPWLNADANLTLSKNKIKDFTAYYDQYDEDFNALGTQEAIAYHNTDISYAPNIIGAGTINILPLKNLQLSLLGKYVGKQYLDNTQDETRKLNDYYNQDIRLTFTIKNKLAKEINIMGYMYNAFNKMYATNGAAYPSWISGSNILSNYNYYYPYAGRHYAISLNLSL